MRIWLVVLLATVGCAARDPLAELEDHLYAPCCYRQSLRDHESPIANTLRAELAARLDGGESPAEIEVDLVHRYGDGIRAIPPGRDPRPAIGAIAFAVVALALVAIVRRARPGIPAPRSAAAPRPDPLAERERLTDRLDDELAAFDG